VRPTAFDDLYSQQLSFGGTLLVSSTGSNTATTGGDIAGGPGDYSVTRLRSTVSLASNLATGVSLGDVLTIVQASPAVAQFATPSNAAAVNVTYDNLASGMLATEVQSAIDELSTLLGYGSATLGTLTAGGSPVTIINDTSHNGFPGLARLDADRVIAVYRKGTSHLENGKICAKIGTLAADYSSVSSWGAEYDILDAADDLRLEDGVSVIGGRVVIVGRHYDGTKNIDPFILVSDDLAADLTSSTTWTSYDITITGYSYTANCNGRMLALSDGTYLIAYVGQDTGLNRESGILISSSMTDWSAPTQVIVGPEGVGDLAEIDVEELSDGTLRANLRREASDETYTSTSSDMGATWSAPALAYDGTGFPMFRELLSGFLLAVYRDAPAGDNAWRYSDDLGATWSTETILDTNGARSEYASLLQLTQSKILAIYGVQITDGNADIFTQVFTDSSLFGPSETLNELSDVSVPTPSDGDALIWDSGTSLWIAASPAPAVGSNSTHVRETSTAGASTTLFSPFDHAHAGIGQITASSSNTLQRGTVNLRPGSNVSFGLTDADGDGEMDTLTVNATGGGGAGTVSAGSNSSHVAEVSSAGASSTLWSPFDHIHAGIAQVTSSSSNTLQRGTVNLRAGTNVGLTASDTDGDGELDTVTISASAAGGAAAFAFTGFVLQAFPFGFSPGVGDTGGSTVNDAWANPYQIPGVMYVRSLRIKCTASAAGTVQWGLFDYSTSATAATKVVGGAAALGSTGWVDIDATSAPVRVEPGNYLMVLKLPAANSPTIAFALYTGTIGPGAARRYPSYTWDDTPDFTSGSWAANPYAIKAVLVGDMDASGQEWAP
jgi:uncharacterized protein (DUF2141 family)